MIRLIIAFIVIVALLIFGLPLYLLYFIIGKFNKNLRDKICLITMRIAFKIIMFICGVKLTVKGKENLPEGAVLYVANHRSIFDIFVGYSQVDRLTGFISKKEVKKYPIVPWWMEFMNCLFLDRSSAKAGLKTILQAVDYAKNGISIFIFPEGTRSKDGTVAEFKAGSFKIAEKAGVPVVPVAFDRTEDIFERQKPFIKSAKVTMSYGKPIYMDKLDKEEKKRVNEMAREAIVEMIEANK